MEETKEIKRFSRKKKITRTQLTLYIAIAIIIIPCLVFFGILGISAIQTGSPRNGNRFKNDLVNKISSDQVSNIKNLISGLSNVESVEVKVSEGQLKVYVDTLDSLNEEGVDSIVTDAYNVVIKELPIATYFTKTNSAKMYDLQINVYTTIENSEGRQYKLLHKNSAEDNYMIDDMAHPIDAKLVSELEGKISSSDVVEEEEKPEE